MAQMVDLPAGLFNFGTGGYKPAMHVNYVNRIYDFTDKLPKYVDGPAFMGGTDQQVDNKGNPIGPKKSLRQKVKTLWEYVTPPSRPSACESSNQQSLNVDLLCQTGRSTFVVSLGVLAQQEPGARLCWLVTGGTRTRHRRALRRAVLESSLDAGRACVGSAAEERSGTSRKSGTHSLGRPEGGSGDEGGEHGDQYFVRSGKASVQRKH
eukprot:6434008-Prymnesium_polylepis.1